MAENQGEIKVESGSIAEALLQLKDITARLAALSPGKGKQTGDSGYVGEAAKEYELKLRLIIEQMKSLVCATQQFLQRADSTFVEADTKSAQGMK